MMRKGKKLYILSEPLFHAIIVLSGLALIVFLPDSEIVCDRYKKIISVSMDIGVGLFPTGLMGLILVFMQKAQKDSEKFNQRITLLKELDIKLHNYLNEMCRTFSSEANSNIRIVGKILISIKDIDGIVIDQDLIKGTEELSFEIEKFLNDRTNYLLTEMFDVKEMEALSLLNENLVAFKMAYIQDNPLLVQRFKKTSNCLLKFLKIFSEFHPYLKLTYSGSHIQ